jgi:hypothetical protein
VSCEPVLSASSWQATHSSSRDPVGRDHLKPDSVTQRYSRLVTRLGIETPIHKLRTYNATELLAAGLDIRKGCWSSRPRQRRRHDDAPLLGVGHGG